VAEVDKDSRTEQPTAKRREEALREGQVPKSPELNTAVMIVAALMVGSWAVPAVFTQHRENVLTWLTIAGSLDVTLQTISTVFATAGRQIGLLVFPMMLTALLAGAAAQIWQVGFKVRPQRLAPDLKRINPLKGAKKFTSPDALVTLAKSVFKLAFVGYVAYRVVVKSGTGAEELVALETGDMLSFLGVGVRRTVAWVAAALVVLAILDYTYARYRNQQDLKMTKHEVKDELRATEGDPQLKRRFRRFHQELSKNRMLAEVAKADVVLTNPVHVAVALRYIADMMRAPQVIAKGAGELAEHIKAVARRTGVPIVERRALARALFRTVKIGQEIPAALYRAVAEVLAYIYSLRRAPEPDATHGTA
jgi:flagellar biosynthetic protein FlhB